jgi:hypothetical protein
VWESAGKPGSVVDNHSSGMPVARHLKQPTRERCGPHHSSPIWSCSEWGLPCHPCCQGCGALLPHHFTLTSPDGLRRYHFCGTFHRLTPSRRYLAPCPAEPGLSSIRRAYSDCLADSHFDYTLGRSISSRRLPRDLVAVISTMLQARTTLMSFGEWKYSLSSANWREKHFISAKRDCAVFTEIQSSQRVSTQG